MAVANFLLTVASPAEISSSLATLLSEVANSVHFDADEIRAAPWTFSQAYCLLWQNEATGDLEGRKCCEALQAGLTSAIILDLVACGRVAVTCRERHMFGIKWEKPALCVLNREPTGTYLDAAFFNELVAYTVKRPRNPRLVEQWLAASFNGEAAKIVLHNLAEQGIVSVVKGLAGRKRFPILNPEPQEWLKAQLRAAAVGPGEPLSFIQCLLTLLLGTDALLYRPKLTQPHFSAEEFAEYRGELVRLARRTREESRLGSPGGEAAPLRRSPAPWDEEGEDG